MVDGVAELISYIFPGQGSQYVGMGKSLIERFPIAKEIFQEADDAINFNLSQICFDGPEEILKLTSNTQPAIFVHSVAIWKILNQTNGKMFAGHSLGEYSALVAAGAMQFSDAIKIVRLRGELMLKAGIKNPGTMAAIVGLENNIVEEICAEISKSEIVQPANFNSPSQVVISGSKNGVQIAMEKLKLAGAKIVKELVVSGAFHSPLMASAKEELTEALGDLKINDLTNPVFANVTANGVFLGSEIRNLLCEQLTAPVKWSDSILNMVNFGATEFIEIGPGKVLQGLVKRISPNVKINGLDTAIDIEKFMNL